MSGPEYRERKSSRPIIGRGCTVAGREGKRIVIGFDVETFDQIRAMAVKRQVPFGAVVRELVEFGLIDVGEGV